MIFQAYFTYLRGRQSLAKDRKTIRMLESLIRLAEAHARLMFKKDIEIFDAICVIVLMEKCVNTGLLDSSYSCLLSKENYSQAKIEVLRKLGLDPFYFTDDCYDAVKYEKARQPQRPNFREDTTQFIGLDTTNTYTHTVGNKRDN
jgi:hypothetical protein